jgi:hypothetical protein
MPIIMKKLFLFVAMILMTGIVFGQTLQKGNLVGTHILTVTLQPGVTIEKYMEFIKSKVLPEYEKNMPNMKVYLVKGIRGENINSFGEIIVFKTEKDRDNYFNPDGSQNELGKSIIAKFKPVLDELGKLGTSTTKYTDWIVQ